LSPSAPPRPKVFGLGLNKTGTKTLARCLEALGYRHQSYNGAALQMYVDGRAAELVDLTERFDSCEDWPWPLLWRELFARYGDSARYVLTRRASPQVWIESLKAHATRTHPTLALRPLVYGHYYPHGYEAEHQAAYVTHNARVRDVFARKAPHAFLEVCWEEGAGWEALCGFLGQPVPDKPFPHERPLAGQVDEAVRAANLAGIERQLAEIAAGRRMVADTPLMRQAREQL
jgi:hypothetical protein